MQPITSAVAPIAIPSGSRHFVDKSGRPFFWLGDTLWHLFRSVPLAEVREILLNRRAKGFSAVLVMLFGYEADPQPNINGDLPWIDSDPTRPNERYFQHVDAAMRIACDLDFIQVLGVYHKCQVKYYTPQQAGDSARWIAQRYRHIPHLIWSMYPEAKLDNLPTIRAIADGLRQGDAGSHLITVHPDPSPQSSSFLHDEPWLSFNSLQTWNEIEQVYPMTAADYARLPAKPAIMAEGGYEAATIHRNISALDIRRQAWWTYLAGGHHVYGHDGNWRSPATWRDWIDAPGTTQFAVYRNIVTTLSHWWDIVPDQSIFAKGVGSGVEIKAAARSRRADWALVYFSSRTPATIRMDRIKALNPITAFWINPADGERTPATTLAPNEVRESTPPDTWDDALLLLK